MIFGTSASDSLASWCSLPCFWLLKGASKDAERMLYILGSCTEFQIAQPIVSPFPVAVIDLKPCRIGSFEGFPTTMSVGLLTDTVSA